MITTGGNRLSAIPAATLWLSSGYQVFVVNITQHRGNAKSYALANFNVRDVAAAHPDLDRTLSNPQVMRHLPLCKQAMLERDRCLRQCRCYRANWLPGLTASVVFVSVKFATCDHILNRTARENFAGVRVARNHA